MKNKGQPENKNRRTGAGKHGDLKTENEEPG